MIIIIIITHTLFVDIDECSGGSSSCNQVCTNEPGDYNYSCFNGYILLPDNYTCEGNTPFTLQV